MVAHQPAAEAVEDQVPRLKAWLAAHPGYWVGVKDRMWTCEGTYGPLAVAYDLGILLDRLEANDGG